MKPVEITARKMSEFDAYRADLRRGFLDVHTPLEHRHELYMSIDEQRALFKESIAMLEKERARLYDAIGRPNKKNFTYSFNKKPGKRNAIRSRSTQFQRDADRYLDLGRRILELQQRMPKCVKI